jgi:hypothetical protein
MGRVDQGVDWAEAGRIPALGRGHVTDVGSASIVEGGTWPVVVYELDDPPPNAPSRYVYVAENFTPTVKRGDRLKPGQEIGRAAGKYPYIEVGFNRTPQGWTAFGDLSGPQSAGYAMRRYITNVTSGGPPAAGVGAGANAGANAGVGPPGPQGPIGGSRPRPKSGDGGILGFFDAAGADIGSAAGWVAATGESAAGGITGAAGTVWNDTVGSVTSAVDFLRAALWLVNAKNWLRAVETIVGFVLIVLAVLIFVKADEALAAAAAGQAGKLAAAADV